MKKMYLALILPLILTVAFAQGFGFDFNKDFIEPYIFWIILIFFAAVTGGMVYASTKTYREEIAPFLGLFAAGAVALAIYFYRDSVPFLFGADVLGIAIIAFLGIGAIAVMGFAGGLGEGIGSKAWLLLIIIGLLLVIIGSAFYPILSVIGVLLIFLGAIWGLIILLTSISEGGGIGGGGGLGGLGLGGERPSARAPPGAAPGVAQQPSTPGVTPTTTPTAAAPPGATLQVVNFYPRRNQIVKPGVPIRIEFNLPVHKRSTKRVFVRDKKARRWLDMKNVKVRIKRTRITMMPSAKIYPVGHIDVYIKTGPNGVIGINGEYLPPRPKYFTFRFFSEETKKYKSYSGWYKSVMQHWNDRNKYTKEFLNLEKIAVDPIVKAKIKNARYAWGAMMNKVRFLPKPDTVRVADLKSQKQLWKQMKNTKKILDITPKLLKKARKAKKIEDVKIKIDDFIRRSKTAEKALDYIRTALAKI